MPEPTIYPFDSDLRHRQIVPYNPVYPEIYGQVKDLIETRFPAIKVTHIGSTAVRDLRGKPMVDLFALTPSDLRQTQASLMALGFHRRDVSADRDDKPYVCGSVRRGGEVFNVNIHICPTDDQNYREIVRFRDLLRQHADLRRRYEEAKDRAHAAAPADHEAYNRAKAPVIRSISE